MRPLKSGVIGLHHGRHPPIRINHPANLEQLRVTYGPVFIAKRGREEGGWLVVEGCVGVVGGQRGETDLAHVEVGDAPVGGEAFFDGSSFLGVG